MKWHSNNLKEIFPYSDILGTDNSNIKTQKMQKVAEGKSPLSLENIKNIIKQHHHFLNTGGAGGRWQTLQLQGIVIGIYVNADASAGMQAVFEKQHISPEIDLQEVILPFANFCGAFCKNQDFSEANLSHCLFTDANLENTIFAEANLQNCDFSRANLRNVSFMNADLSGTDFENCDLTNADFRGAFLENSRFPGAILKGVKY